ncbi:MAG: hypothetical protein M0P02_05330 [Sulfurospirillaceae bacterium]|jgi:hypothetical protein|nr:hypothetical protein [Sulfurospirillaceae bacterium]MCK9545926.1 hypothetical protein [Sulfurospirillaceae bacterium]MDY0238264.1 hypothetical protein [Campylobacterales bacterium]
MKKITLGLLIALSALFGESFEKDVKLHLKDDHNSSQKTLKNFDENVNAKTKNTLQSPHTKPIEVQGNIIFEMRKDK